MVEVKPVSSISGKNNDKLEIQTKEILDKIAEVNKKHGLSTKRKNPNYFQFPFSYYKSNSGIDQQRQRSDFKFPSNPFSNPIFDYLQRERHQTDNEESRTTFDSALKHMVQPNFQEGYQISMTTPNAEVTADDLIPGHYVKRKIVHQQTILVPNPNYMPPQIAAAMPNISPNLIPQYTPQLPFVNNLPIPFSTENNGSDNKVLNHLENQTVDNIKNIVSYSQVSPFSGTPLYYPYQQLPLPNSNVPPQARYGLIVTPDGNMLGQIPYNYQIRDPYSSQNVQKGRQNWNWPGQNYFPIHIRDPFTQMFNAITSMIEYGPGAGTSNPCPGRPIRKEVNNDIFLREAKTTVTTQNFVEEGRNFNSPGTSTTSATTDSDKDYLSVENIDVGASREGEISFVALNKERIGKDAEAVKKEWERMKIAGKATSFVINGNNTRANSKKTGTEKIVPSLSFSKSPTVKREPVSSPPKRDPEQSDEFDDDELEKSEEIISNDGNKKFFSRDNTGSGVFINRLKVRKGGVAIAGPGGIATAGSGGTAIVGPNGVAYTHPDSLAIAGSGTKVVAVDPLINLRDIIGNTTNANKANLSFPPSRVGKVVAVGPVVYYNKG